MSVNIRIRYKLSRPICLVLLLSCVLALFVGCSSRENTRISSGLPNAETNTAQLEESPIEVPDEIMVSPPLKDETPLTITQPVIPLPIEEPQNLVSEPPSSASKGDVFASSSQASPPSVTIPQSTPVPELAKPSDLNGLPFTLSDIFFDFDQYTIREEDVRVLETNAKILLGRYPKKKVLIQGHCDERGTEEYNFALGVRRAQAVKDYLSDLGVPSEKMEVLSMGKEKPFCTEHSWNCWKHNRRSHFIFQ